MGSGSGATVGGSRGGGGGAGPVSLEGALAQAAAGDASSAARAASGGGAPADGLGGGAQSATSRSSATHHHQSTAASARAAPDAARGPHATEIRAPTNLCTGAPRSLTRVRTARGSRRRGSARAATRRLERLFRPRTTAPEHYFGTDAPRRCRRPPAARCQFYAKLRAGGDAICTASRPPASALFVR